MENCERYVRIESVVYVKVKGEETPEEVEKRFLCALPEGCDCVKLNIHIDSEEA